jgi:integrase
MKKRADGRYCKTISVNGQRYFIYGESPQDLEDKYIEFKIGQKKGLSYNDKTTLGELTQVWYETYIKGKKAQKTQDMYKTVINNHVTEFADYKLKDIKPLMIDRYLKNLNKSKSLEHKIRITLNQIFKLAKSNKLIDDNPMEYVKSVAQGTPKREFLDDEDRNIVLKALEGHKGYLLVLTLLYTGMREGEALALTWRDFDDINGIIKVSKAIEWQNSHPVIKQPKTKAGIRQIPIPSELTVALLSEKEKSKGISPYIFHHSNNGMHTKSSSDRLWRSSKKAINKYIDEKINKHIMQEDQKVNINLTFRLLRHTYATGLYDAGIDLKSAQEILGHADFKVTMDIYTHIQNERRDKNIIKIQDLYKKKEIEKAAHGS